MQFADAHTGIMAAAERNILSILSIMRELPAADVYIFYD